MSRIEIRTYEGDGFDLAELVQRSWRSGLEGKAWFPLWDQAYFAWRVLDERIGAREFCLAAYDGTKPVGCILAEPIDLQIGDQTVRGSYCSWLSVDPETKSRGVAMRMCDELRARHRARDIMISVGVTRSDPASPARRMWDTLAKRDPQEYQFWQPIHFWGRVLDAHATSAAGLNALERWGPKLLGLVPRLKFLDRPSPHVRPYQPSDLPECLRFLQAQGQAADLRMIWNPARLGLQLGPGGYPRTVVYADERGPRAFLNYYVIQWSGAKEIRVGLIDLFAGDGGFLQQRRLLKSAEQQMRAEGVHVAMMMMSPASPGPVLVSRGYAPVNAHAEVFGMFIDSRLVLPPVRRLHILFT